MTIDNTDLLCQPLVLYKTNPGHVFFFLTLLHGQVQRRVDINLRNFNEIDKLIETHYKDRPSHFVPNQINSYSIVTGNTTLFNRTYPNCFAYALLVCNPMIKKEIVFEIRFIMFNGKTVGTIKSAISRTENSQEVLLPPSYFK